MARPYKSGIPIQIAVAVMAAASLFALGYSTGKRKAEKGIKTEVVHIVHRDTISLSMPVSIRETDAGFIPYIVRDTVIRLDTVFIPRTTKEYRDTNYYAVVSGYEPNLDYIETYNTTIIRTERQIVSPPRFSFGIQAGIGLQYGFRGVDFGPYLGVGVQYRFAK